MPFHNAKIPRRLQIFVLWGLAGMLMCNRQLISAARGITKPFLDRERCQLREQQELELEQSLASDKKVNTKLLIH